MAATAGDIVTGAASQLHGWGSTQDRIAVLTSDIAFDDVSFKVDATFGQSVGITPGMVEIDQEQLYVTSVDSNSGVCTLANGFGRGYNGTTAVTHLAGSRVTSRPKFPRVTLFKTMNDIVGGLFPDLYVVNKFETTVTFPINSYTLPTPPGWIISVQWKDMLGNWVNHNVYQFDQFDGSFRLGGGVMIGRPMRILYATEPQPMTFETDLFADTTGLPESCADLVQLGIVSRLTPGLDISRAQVTSVEQSDRSRVVPQNAGITVSKYVAGEYQDRLANEMRALRKQYGPRLRRTW